MKSIFLSILGLFIISVSFAQSNVIKGKAPGAEGKTIRLSTFDDLITYKKKNITEAEIDDKGYFELKLNNKKTIIAYLNIDFHIAEIYIEPKTNYNLVFTKNEYADTKVNVFLHPPLIDYLIKDADKFELNSAIIKLNNMYLNFMHKNVTSLKRRLSKTKIDSFHLKVNTEFSDVTSEYFKNMVIYKIAMLEETSSIYYKEKIIMKYFHHKPVLFNNVEYMDFFYNLFSNYLGLKSKQINKNQLLSLINEKTDYFLLNDYIGTDTCLRDERLREMVILLNLNEMYYNPRYKAEKVFKLLQQIASSTKFNEHKKIAENIIHTVTKLKPGTKAPDFTLPDFDGGKVSLSSFEGKYVFLTFWTSWCIPCQSEMKIIKKLYEKFTNNVDFVNISVDLSPVKTSYFLENNDYNWYMLHFAKNYDLLEKYQVTKYPYFILINPGGEILSCPVANPSEKLEGILTNLLKNY